MKAKVFDRFTGGEFGRQGEYAPDDSFSTIGQWEPLYVGSYGLVPGGDSKPIDLTGGPNSPDSERTWLAHLANNGAGPLIVFITGSVVYSFPIPTAGSGSTPIRTYTGTALATTPEFPPQVWATEDVSYLLWDTANFHKLNHVTGVVSTVTGPAQKGRVMADYNDRLIIASPPAQPNRLYYSAAGSPETWPALNYIDVGDSSPIVGLYAMRNRLVIVKGGVKGNRQSPLGGEWWVLTGVPGVNATLRQIAGRPSPGQADQAAVLGDGSIAFIDPHRTTLGIFDGAAPRLLHHLTLTDLGEFGDTFATAGDLVSPWVVRSLNHGGDVGVFMAPGLDDANPNLGAYAAGPACFVRRRGVWTAFHYDAEEVRCPPVPVPSLGMWVYLRTNAIGSPTYSWRMARYDHDRPPDPADTYAQVSADANVIELPELRAPAGVELAVRYVEIEYRRWRDTDASTLAQGSVGAEVYTERPSDGSAPDQSNLAETTGVSWDAQSLPTIPGQDSARCSATIVCAERWGRGAVVRLKMTGCTVSRVIVAYDERNQAHR